MADEQTISPPTGDRIYSYNYDCNVNVSFLAKLIEDDQDKNR